jgi:hypothetical protein
MIQFRPTTFGAFGFMAVFSAFAVASQKQSDWGSEYWFMAFCVSAFCGFGFVGLTIRAHRSFFDRLLRVLSWTSLFGITVLLVIYGLLIPLLLLDPIATIAFAFTTYHAILGVLHLLHIVIVAAISYCKVLIGHLHFR